MVVVVVVKVGAVQKQPESLGATSCAFQQEEEYLHDLDYYNGVEHFVRDSPVL